MHREALLYIERVTANLPIEGSRVLELGSYDVNGSARPFFAQAREYIGVDLRPGPGVDEVADAKEYKSRLKFDFVVCTEVLEHDPYPREIVRQAYDLLKKGGFLILTAAADPRAPHGVMGLGVGNEYYKNIDPGDLELWFDNDGWSKFDVDYDPGKGDVYALAKK